MHDLGDAWQYALDNRDTVVSAIETQLQLSGLALAIALFICVPLGIVASSNRWVSLASVNFFGTARVVPSIAILFLALPYLGLGFQPALVALTVLACPPILINTSTGFGGVAPAVVEAARGMGMSRLQLMWQIELPLAFPVMLAGIRTAAVEVIASATLATFIGGGGLGDFISQGFATNDASLMLVGAVPVAALALAAELILGGMQRVFAQG
jgi:osmoprotectant transport system permease protein